MKANYFRNLSDQHKIDKNYGPTIYNKEIKKLHYHVQNSRKKNRLQLLQ